MCQIKPTNGFRAPVQKSRSIRPGRAYKPPCKVARPSRPCRSSAESDLRECAGATEPRFPDVAGNPFGPAQLECRRSRTAFAASLVCCDPSCPQPPCGAVHAAPAFACVHLSAAGCTRPAGKGGAMCSTKRGFTEHLWCSWALVFQLLRLVFLPLKATPLLAFSDSGTPRTPRTPDF